MRVCVVGLGEIGGSVFRALGEHSDKVELHGCDINQAIFPNFSGVKYANLSADLPIADVYLISVWNIEQIIGTLGKIAAQGPGPLVVIESTIDMSRFDDLMRSVAESNLTVATFPHRWNPGDPEHGVFNQNRVLGADTIEAIRRAHDFYLNFMDDDNIHITDFWTAAASKVCENAYRFVEIVLAQDLRKAVEMQGRSFSDLREAMNTKWNIDVREARDGVKGKCLPKDVAIFNSHFASVMFNIAELLNEKHKSTKG